jgi:hypothetical protein
VSPLPPGVPAKRAELAKTISAVVSSCAGVGGAASICAAHSSTRVALLVFASMQVWPLCELICRWRMKWHYMRLYENVVNKAVENPDNANLRTLLADLASTHLDDLGERIPIRGDLKKLSRSAGRAPALGSDQVAFLASMTMNGGTADSSVDQAAGSRGRG